MVAYIPPTFRWVGFTLYHIKSVIREAIEHDKYDFVGPIEGNGTILVKKNGLFGIINEHGEELLEIEYEFISPFGEGFRVISHGRKVGGIFGLNNIKWTYDPK